MNGWEYVPLGSLAADSEGAIAIGPFGSAMKADTYTATGVPVIRGTNISNSRAWRGDWVYIPDSFADSMPRCIVRCDDLVFPHRGSIGEVALVPSGRYDRYFLSTSLMKITVDRSKVEPLFVYYFFKSSRGRNEILKYASQVGTPGVGQPLSSLRRFMLPLPPREYQTRISKVLGTLDDKIDLNRRMNETLEAIAKAIFKDWFVKFGPTRAKMLGRAPYLTPEIWALFPGSLDDRDRPKDWNSYSVADLAILTKESISPAAVPDEVFEHHSLPAFDNGGSPSLDAGVSIKSNKTLVPCDAILLSKLNPEISRVWLPDAKTHLRQVASTEFLAFQPCKASARALIYHLFCSDSFKAMLEGMVTGTSRSHQRVSPTDLMARQAIVGEPGVFAAFANIIAPMIATQMANRACMRTLINLRNLLLPKLMYGGIRIRDAEQIAQAAA